MLDIAAVESRICTLKTDTMLIFGRIAKNMDDAEIAAWSGSWKFSIEKVASARAEIYRVFDLDGCISEAEKRRRAHELYNAWSDVLLKGKREMQRLSPHIRSAHADAIRDIEEENETMDAHTNEESTSAAAAAPMMRKDNPVIDMPRLVKALGELTPRQNEFVECLRQGIKNPEIAKKLGVGLGTPSVTFLKIYEKLGIGSLVRGCDARRYITAAAHIRADEHGKADAVMKEMRGVATALKPARMPECYHPQHSHSANEERESATPEMPGDNGKSGAAYDVVTESQPALMPGASTAPPVRNGTVVEMPHGPGTPIVLADPQRIVDVLLVSGEQKQSGFAERIEKGRRAGMFPEVLIVYPDRDPERTRCHVVLVKRTT